MERQRWIKLFLVGALVLSLAGGVRAQDPIPQGGVPVQAAPGTAFTYQGQLLDGGSVVDGTCDIQFSLYDAATDGGQVGSTVIKTNVIVTDGLFTVELDFGASAFAGDPRWLQLAVRCPAGSGTYDTLSPRQSLTPTPYAVYASHAAAADIASTVETGAITPTHLNGIAGNGASGQMLSSDGSGGFAWQSASPAKQLVQDFVVASGESVSAGDVVSFLNGQIYGPRDEWGGESVFNAAVTEYVAVSALSATDFVVAYRDGGNSAYGTAIVGTVGGGTLLWGNESVFNAASSYLVAVSALSRAGFVVAYRDDGNAEFGTMIAGTVGGRTLSWGSESVFHAASTDFVAVSALSATDFVVAYQDAGKSSYGTAIAGTHRRYIGTARTAASGGETVTVIIDGVSDVHTGLVPGELYFVQEDGSLDLTPTARRVGLAISATELILDQLW